MFPADTLGGALAPPGEGRPLEYMIQESKADEKTSIEHRAVHLPDSGTVPPPLRAVFGDIPTFSDVPESHWAYSYVEQAVDKGWVAGIGNGLFGVDDPVTYAQLVDHVRPGLLSG